MTYTIKQSDEGWIVSDTGGDIAEFMTAPKAQDYAWDHGATLVIVESESLIRIYPFGKGNWSEVSVYKPETRYEGKLYPAKVNWSALGACEPEYAKQYAEAILKASELAEELNK